MKKKMITSPTSLSISLQRSILGQTDAMEFKMTHTHHSTDHHRWRPSFRPPKNPQRKQKGGRISSSPFCLPSSLNDTSLIIVAREDHRKRHCWQYERGELGKTQKHRTLQPARCRHPTLLPLTWAYWIYRHYPRHPHNVPPATARSPKTVHRCQFKPTSSAYAPRSLPLSLSLSVLVSTNDIISQPLPTKLGVRAVSRSLLWC